MLARSLCVCHMLVLYQKGCIDRAGFCTQYSISRRKSATGSQPNFARCLAVCWIAGILYIHFRGSCPLSEFCQVQNSLLRPSFAFSCFGSITARYWSSGRQPNFCGMVQVIEPRNFRSPSFPTEGATYIPRAAITLIGHRPAF